MNANADAARLTIQLRGVAAGQGAAESVAVTVVERAHAVGLWGATTRRGGGPAAANPGIPAPRTLSLADEEGATVTVIGAEEQLRAFARGLDGIVGDDAVFRIEVDGRERQLDMHEGPALSR